MDERDAYKQAIIKFPNANFSKCMEYNTCFVFQAENLGSMDNLIGVEKETGKVFNFKPTMIDIDDYLNGLELKNYK